MLRETVPTKNVCQTAGQVQWRWVLIQWQGWFMFERVRKGSFKVGDTCAYSRRWVGDFPGEQGAIGNKQCLQSRENKMGIENGMRFSKHPTLHSHTSSTGISWKCHPLPHSRPPGLSHPSHPASSLHLCLLTVSWTWRSNSNCFPYSPTLPHCGPSLPSLLILPYISNFNGRPAAFFCLPNSSWSISTSFAHYQVANWVGIPHMYFR